MLHEGTPGCLPSMPWSWISGLESVCVKETNSNLQTPTRVFTGFSHGEKYQPRGFSPIYVTGTVTVFAMLLITRAMAERVGFEPTLPVRVNTLSKRAPSATRPSLQRLIRIASAGMPMESPPAPQRWPSRAVSRSLFWLARNRLGGERSCVLFVLLCSVVG